MGTLHLPELALKIEIVLIQLREFAIKAVSEKHRPTVEEAEQQKKMIYFVLALALGEFMLNYLRSRDSHYLITSHHVLSL